MALHLAQRGADGDLDLAAVLQGIVQNPNFRIRQRID
jgi:hypothetical protein